jgi:hypothetical protein
MVTYHDQVQITTELDTRIGTQYGIEITHRNSNMSRSVTSTKYGIEMLLSTITNEFVLEKIEAD